MTADEHRAQAAVDPFLTLGFIAVALFVSGIAIWQVWRVLF